MGALRAVAALWIAACTVAACTSTATLPPAETDWPSRQALLAKLDNWQLSGKLAVKTRTGAETARIDWQQTGTRTHLTLTGPGGWGRATVIADKHTLLLEKDGQQRLLDLADSAALERELGWDMPAAMLSYWIRGIPAPGIEIEAQALSGGRLSLLQQSGWSLHYERYQQVGHLTLPARIIFKGKSASGKIIIKQWKLDASRS
ncbi:MAG: lipoprotein insertase outer membrane protein LolB [Gammaproteobacteria bacterium]|nr:lipoprotein insertase outer membrane protein LolB [Gammaproteobacteria bacterium]